MLEIPDGTVEIHEEYDMVKQLTTVRYHHPASGLYHTYTKENPPSLHPMISFWAIIRRRWWTTNRIDKAILVITRTFGVARASVGSLHPGESWEEYTKNLTEEQGEIVEAIRALEFFVQESKEHKALADDLARKLWDTQEKLRELEGTLQAAQAKVLSLQQEVRQTPAWYRRCRNLLLVRLRGRRGIETTGTTPMVPDS